MGRSSQKKHNLSCWIHKTDWRELNPKRGWAHWCLVDWGSIKGPSFCDGSMGQRVTTGFRTECEAGVWALGWSQKPAGARALISLRIGYHNLKLRLLCFLALGQSPERKTRREMGRVCKSTKNGRAVGFVKFKFWKRPNIVFPFVSITESSSVRSGESLWDDSEGRNVRSDTGLEHSALFSATPVFNVSPDNR